MVLRSKKYVVGLFNINEYISGVNERASVECVSVRVCVFLLP